MDGRWSLKQSEIRLGFRVIGFGMAAELRMRRRRTASYSSRVSAKPRAVHGAVRFNRQNLQRSRRRNYTNQHTINSRNTLEPRQAAKEAEQAATEFRTEQKCVTKKRKREREIRKICIVCVCVYGDK